MFQNMASNYATGAVQNMAKDAFGKMLPSGMKLPGTSSLKKYFNVDNAYVKNKLTLLLFPFKHKQWQRETEQEYVNNNGVQGVQTVAKPPRGDVNAPDLYIPTMAAATYILAMALVAGLQSSSSSTSGKVTALDSTSVQFSPDIIATCFSSAVGTLVFELIALKLGLYILGGQVAPPPLLDLIAYTGYIFVPLVINLFVYLLLGSAVYWLALIYTGFAFGLVFLTRTLKHIFVTNIAVDRQSSATKTRNLFLLVIGGLQIPLMMFLGRLIV